MVGEKMNRRRSFATAALLVGLEILLQQAAVTADVYNVGDGAGWTINNNYTQWANQYTFREGDTIVFLYSRGSHDVLRVNQRAYLSCSSENPIETDASGETAFQLRAGTYYFICGFPAHCDRQQKVFVKVLPGLGPGLPALPSYSQSARAPAGTAATLPNVGPAKAQGSFITLFSFALAALSSFL